MKIEIEIQDSKLKFALEVLRSLSFVKKANPVSEEKSQLVSEVEEAVHNLNLVKKGKAKSKPARELLNEL